MILFNMSNQNGAPSETANAVMSQPSQCALVAIHSCDGLLSE